jgi:hypothetical protein
MVPYIHDVVPATEVVIYGIVDGQSKGMNEAAVLLLVRWCREQCIPVGMEKNYYTQGQSPAE